MPSQQSSPLSLDEVRKASASRLSKHPQPLVAVFTGGTSGIAEYTLHALARHAEAGNGAVIYIVGRNKAAAEKTAAGHAEAKNITIRFVQASDLSLIRDVDKCCDELAKTMHEHADSPHIDLLVMSHADLSLGPRRETPEGLDKLMSLLYYSRIRFTQNLMPLLEATSLPSSRVISIYAGGMEEASSFFPEDLSLRDPQNFGFASVRNHVVHMKTMAFETLAERHPKVGLVHVYPGLVITPGFDRNPMPWWFKAVWPLVAPIASWFALAHDDIAQWMLGFMAERYGGRAEAEGHEGAAEATDGVLGAGAYAVKYDGLVHGGIAAYDELRPLGFRDTVWQHTAKALKVIQEGKVFRD